MARPPRRRGLDFFPSPLLSGAVAASQAAQVGGQVSRLGPPSCPIGGRRGQGRWKFNALFAQSAGAAPSPPPLRPLSPGRNWIQKAAFKWFRCGDITVLAGAARLYKLMPLSPYFFARPPASQPARRPARSLPPFHSSNCPLVPLPKAILPPPPVRLTPPPGSACTPPGPPLVFSLITQPVPSAIVWTTSRRPGRNLASSCNCFDDRNGPFRGPYLNWSATLKVRTVFILISNR